MQPGQPDWQRYQSSSGPSLFVASGAGTQTSGILFVGPWRSWFAHVTITGGTGVWTLTAQWYTDKTGTNLLLTETSVATVGIDRVGWLPVVSQFVRFTLTNTKTSTGDTASVSIMPSLLDSPQAARAFSAPLIEVYEPVLNHNNFTTYDASLVLPGPARLSLRANVYSFVWDLLQMESNGTFTSLMRYQIANVNEAREYDLLLPDKPVRIKATNVMTWAKATYDIVLAPA